MTSRLSSRKITAIEVASELQKLARSPATVNPLASPLHRDRRQRIGLKDTVEAPERTGVARLGDQRIRVTRAGTDEEIGDVIPPADGLVAVEKGFDFAKHFCRSRRRGRRRAAQSN